MTVLLDTHVVLTWASGGAGLAERARDLIADASSTVLVSAATFYEIGIKFARGRLDLPSVPAAYLPRIIRRHRFGMLPITGEHALRAGGLPFIHRDPWDRLLVAQAQIENIPIITADPAIGQYEVEVIW